MSTIRWGREWGWTAGKQHAKKRSSWVASKSRKTPLRREPFPWWIFLDFQPFRTTFHNFARLSTTSHDFPRLSYTLLHRIPISTRSCGICHEWPENRAKLFLHNVFREPFGSWASAPTIVNIYTKKSAFQSPRRWAEKHLWARLRVLLRRGCWSIARPCSISAPEGLVSARIFCQGPEEVTFEEPVRRHSWKDSCLHTTVAPIAAELICFKPGGLYL